MFQVNQKAKDSFMDKEITLDGKPAMMCGRLEKFPSITQLVAPFLSIHFSWQHVCIIINQENGQFKINA